jgi:hypothetical protein
MAEIFVGPWAQHDEPDVRDIEEFCGVRATRFGTRHRPNELPRQAAGVLMPLIVARAVLKVITGDGRFMARANVERAGRLHEMQLELSPSVILALAALGVSVPDSDEIYQVARKTSAFRPGMKSAPALS